MADGDSDEIEEEFAAEILESYQKHGDMNKVASEVGTHTGKVSTVVNDPSEYVADPTEFGFDGPDYPSNKGPGGDDEDEEDRPDGFTAEPPPNTREELEEHGPPFDEMSPGDFIKWFFDQDGFGVASDFVNRLARRCDVRGRLPDESKMINTIIEGNSRISNSFDAKMIAETYADALQRYRNENGIPNSAAGGHRGARPDGDWVQGDGEGGQRQQRRGGGGEWVGAEGQPDDTRADPRGGRGAPRGREGGGGRQQGGRQRQGGQQSQGGGGNGVNEQVAEALNEIRETQKMLARSIQQQQQQDQRPGTEDVQEGADSIVEQMEKVEELQNTLERIRGGESGGSDDVSALREELKNMRREMMEEGGSVQVNGDGDMGALLQLAAQDQIDPEMMSVLADSMGVTDPEVKKAEYQYKAEREKMENRKELIDNVFDNLGDVSGDLVGSLVSSVTDNGDEEQAAEAQQPQPQPESPGNEMLDDGEIQVVGENVGGDGMGGPNEEGEEMSPARRRHAGRLGGGGGGGGGNSTSGGFRGPGEGEESTAPDPAELIDEEPVAEDEDA